MSWRLRSIAAGALHLPPAERSTLIVLADYANDDGLCWPSRRTIEQITGLSPATVKRAVRSLAKRGLVVDTGSRRMTCVVRRLAITRVMKADRIAAHRRATEGGSSANPPGLTSDPFGGSSANPPGLTSDPFGGSSVTPRGLTSDPEGGSSVSRGGLTSDPQTPSDPHQEPHHSLPPAPSTAEQGGGGMVDLILTELATKAIDGWTPSAGDRKALGQMVRDVGAPGLLRVAKTLPRWRTHPVSALGSAIERQGRQAPDVAELAVGGSQGNQAKPVCADADQLNALATAIEQAAEAEGAHTTRDAAVAWGKVCERAVEEIPSSRGVIPRLHHLVTVDRGADVVVHLAGSPEMLQLANIMLDGAALSSLASQIDPPRARRVQLHTTSGERA